MSEISFFNKTFWDLWFQKIFRNIASVKIQFLLIFLALIIYGMFNCPADSVVPWISAKLGLGFLGGAFITLATTRIIARTKLIEPSNGELDTEK
jgi:hypothetical protein